MASATLVALGGPYIGRIGVAQIAFRRSWPRSARAQQQRNRAAVRSLPAASCSADWIRRVPGAVRRSSRILTMAWPPMARPMASMARPVEVERLSRKPSPASRRASTAWSICSAGSGGSQVPKARMRCGEFCSASCEISSEVSPLIWGRLSPAAQAIRICGSANSSARNRSAWTCRSAMSVRRRTLGSGRPDPGTHQQDRGHDGKAEQRERRRQHREFLVIEVEPGRNRLRDGQFAGNSGFRQRGQGGGERDQAVARQ